MSGYGSLGRIAGWSFLGWAGGWFIAATICYFQPKEYRSRAGFDGQEPKGRIVELAPIHAERVVRDLELDNRWHIPQGEAIAVVKKAVTIRAAPGGVAVLAGHTNKEDARDIAEEAGRYFRSMDAEVALAAATSEARPLSPKENYDFGLLRDDLSGKARKAGLPDFRLIPRAAAAGEDASAKLWNDPDFQNQWKDYEKFAALMDGLPPDGSAPKLAHLVEKPVIAAKPSSPNVGLYLAAGCWPGLLIGCLIGVRHEKRRPDTPERDGQDGGLGFEDAPPSTIRPTTASAEDDW